MPRGPGKKENYNLDYSRFNQFDLEGLDGLDEEPQPQQAAPAKPTKSKKDKPAEQGGEIPVEMFQNLPGELREAFRLMQLSKQTGDEKAQKRATELAMAAIEKGGPDVKKRFEQEMMREMAKHPDARKEMERSMNESVSAGSISKAGGYPTSTNDSKIKDMENTVKQMGTLREQMEEGQKKAQQQMDTLRKQQEDLEKLAQNGSPEDFFKFMHGQGLSEEDMTRAFSGDEKHMEGMVQKLLDKTDADTDTADPGMKNTLDAVDQLHSGLLGDDWEGDRPDTEAPRLTEKKKKKEKLTPEAAIAQHRVQYKKDDAGRVASVELRAELPGVESMAAIELDVSERHLRLRTQVPAFVVNAGPFPVLVDATAARAKFSKKRQELTVSVPAQ